MRTHPRIVPSFPSRLRAAGALTATALFLGTQMQAATVSWTVGTGNWIDGPNWNTGTIPTSATADIALIDNAGTASINPGEIISTGSLTLGSLAATSGTVVMTGGSLTTTTTDIRIGGNANNMPGGTGRLDQSGGDILMNAGNLNVAIGTAAVGTYNLSGGSLTVNSAAIMAIGNRGMGTVNQTGGTLFVRSQANPATGVIQLGRNAAAVPGFGTFTLSGGTAAASLFKFGDVNQTSGAQSVNTFTLEGTGTLLTGTMSINNPAASNTFNFLGGSLTGTTISLPVINNGGTLRPATLFFGDTAGNLPPTTPAGLITSPIGTTTFTGNNSYIQTAAGTLSIELALTGNDLVDIGATGTGNATLSGTISLSLLNGFDPALGSTFDILKADSITNNAVLSGFTPSGRSFTSTIITGIDGRQVLEVIVVPEPTSVALLAFAALPLLSLRPRRPAPGKRQSPPQGTAAL